MSAYGLNYLTIKQIIMVRANTDNVTILTNGVDINFDFDSITSVTRPEKERMENPSYCIFRNTRVQPPPTSSMKANTKNPKLKPKNTAPPGL